MNRRDKSIREKILGYCQEIEDTHQYFQEDKALFCDRQRGAIYRNAISMPLLQIGTVNNLASKYKNVLKEI